MQWTGLNDLREKYLSFFESKGHLRLPSFPLIPKDDNSLLLINSGMAPMKKYFTGEVTPPRKRVTTCQKCIRTPDIERVGITARHGTFFEMLGNFSFGDYFKKEATAWAWEFFTKVLEMPADRLYISIYQDDDEAFDIWTKQNGVDPSHMVRLGREDNFWEHGSGPCGPCSEIYFDRGEKYGCGKPTCGVGCDCDRYVEVWNLVFTQFENDGNNNYTPLDHPNIDTGMGLERLACVMQGVDNLFLVDTVQNIMKHISRIANVQYGADEKSDVSLRVITDHIRSTTFMISDGVMPSNEGRGYVLRRLLRRAARHGRLLGINHPFLADVVDTVIHENECAYPELREKSAMIKKVIAFEEENFYKTIDKGFALLNDIIDRTDAKVLSGEDAFLLSDTFGFPIDLTKEILSEKGMSVDEDRFRALVLQQRETARASRKNAGADAWAGDSAVLDDIAKTEFVGYTDMKATAKVTAIVKDGARIEAAETGDDIVFTLDRTSFYAESGGQVGDTGVICGDGVTIQVTDVKKKLDGISAHLCKLIKGTVKVGDNLSFIVNEQNRKDICANHSVTHLLHRALRDVLGEHVTQKGSAVGPDRMRFDISHPKQVTAEEIRQVENIVNNAIRHNYKVTTTMMSQEDAIKSGAMALFGEKYGDEVRVVSMGDDKELFSRELCGGTHVKETGDIGYFNIVSESAVAAGIRRLECLTGRGAEKFVQDIEDKLHAASNILKTNPNDLENRIKQLLDEKKKLENDLFEVKKRFASNKAADNRDNFELVNGVKFVGRAIPNVHPKELKAFIDEITPELGSGIVVLASNKDDKASIVVGVTKDLTGRYSAIDLVRIASQTVGGQGGGGRPDMAQAGGPNGEKIADAINAVKEAI